MVDGCADAAGQGGLALTRGSAEGVDQPRAGPNAIGANEAVERTRRIHLNDLENIPFFLAAGFLFILTDPSLQLTRVLMYGYVVTRVLHFLAYFSGLSHEIRSTLWAPGSLIILFMAGRTLFVALGL